MWAWSRLNVHNSWTSERWFLIIAATLFELLLYYNMYPITHFSINIYLPPLLFISVHRISICPFPLPYPTKYPQMVTSDDLSCVIKIISMRTTFILWLFKSFERELIHDFAFSLYECTSLRCDTTLLKNLVPIGNRKRSFERELIHDYAFSLYECPSLSCDTTLLKNLVPISNMKIYMLS